MGSKLAISSFTRSSQNTPGEGNFSYEYEGNTVYCYCGVKAPLVTSNSDENPGRRFFDCSNYKVKGCNFFVWYDNPIADERVKTMMVELRNCNKVLVKENSILKNENKGLRKLVGELKVENGCLLEICSGERFNDLCDEVATLKAEIQDLERKLRNTQMIVRTEGNAKMMYKSVVVFIILLLLYLKVGSDSLDQRKNVSVLALP